MRDYTIPPQRWLTFAKAVDRLADGAPNLTPSDKEDAWMFLLREFERKNWQVKFLFRREQGKLRALYNADEELPKMQQHLQLHWNRLTGQNEPYPRPYGIRKR